MNKPRAVIFDIDGTVTNIEHRKHFAEAKQFGKFYAEAPRDEPHKWCVDLIRTLHNGGYLIILLTGRPEEYTFETKDYCHCHDIPWHALFMKTGSPFQKDYVFKERVYRESIEPYYDVAFVVEDRRRVVDMWRAIGVTCLQCAENDG